jgi:hypothetical protein
MNDETDGATTLEPGHSPGGIPLTVHISKAQMRALTRIAEYRKTTPAALVEALVLNAIAHTEVPPAAPHAQTRSHTTYEKATEGFTRDGTD